MATTSFRIEDEIDNWVESRLVPGQSKSVWYQYATRTTMAVDPILDDLYERYQYDERQDLIEAAVKKEVERRKAEVDNGSNYE